MDKKTKILAIANQKGGVGKTTTVANLAACLAAKNFLVLVIDCDYQANATTLLCGDEQLKHTTKSLTHAIKNDLSLKDVIVATPHKNIDMVPSNHELDSLREQLVGQPNQFSLITSLLDCPLAKKYDYIIIDTHPSLDCFFQSAIAASHYFIIPIFAEADSSRGLVHQIQTINKAKKFLNPALEFLGSLVVKYDRYSSTHQKFEKLIREFSKENNLSIFKTIIPNSHSVAAAAAHGLPINAYKINSPANKAYIKLANEIISATKDKNILKTKTKKITPKDIDLEIATDL